MQQDIGTLPSLDCIDAGPDQRHHHSVDDGPVGSPNAKTGACNDRVGDVVYRTWTPVEAKHNSDHDCI